MFVTIALCRRRKLLPPTALAMKLKGFVESKSLFLFMGVGGMAVMFLLGLYTWYDAATAMMAIDLASAFGETFVVSHAYGCLHR